MVVQVPLGMTATGLNRRQRSVGRHGEGMREGGATICIRQVGQTCWTTHPMLSLYVLRASNRRSSRASWLRPGMLTPSALRPGGREYEPIGGDPSGYAANIVRPQRLADFF